MIPYLFPVLEHVAPAMSTYGTGHIRISSLSVPTRHVQRSWTGRWPFMKPTFATLWPWNICSDTLNKGPRPGVPTAPGAGRGPPPAPEPVSAGLVSGPAAAAPRPCLGPGLAAASAGTGPARRNTAGGSAHRIAPCLHKDADGGFTYPCQGCRWGCRWGCPTSSTTRTTGAGRPVGRRV